MNTDDFRTPTTIAHVPKKASKSYLNVCGQHNADQADQDRVGDPSDLGPIVLISDNYNDRSKNNRPKYDPDLLLRKRMILSNDVRKTTLVKHDERPNEPNIERDAVDDETFFENLKKRIKKDFQNNILPKTPSPSSKRLPKAGKCKSLLNNETRSLMNKFRREFANSQSQKLLSQENGVFSMARRSNNCTREEHTDSAMPHRAVEHDSLRGTPSFHEIHAEANHQPTPSPLERNRVFSMERRGNSWTGENISEHKPMNVLCKHCGTDEDLVRSTLTFNETDADAYNRQPTPSSLERNRVFSMERRGNSWTRENISEHPHPAMAQNGGERGMTKDSLRGGTSFNEFHAEAHNRPWTLSPSERRGAFSMDGRSSSWTRGNIREHPCPAMLQSIMEHKPMNDVLWKHCGTDEDSVHKTLTFNETDADAYNRQPTPSPLERNRAFLMERRKNNSTRESICEHPYPAMAQNVVERGLTTDIMLEYFETEKDSLHGRSSFNEIHTEVYDHQLTTTSSGSNTFVKYYTKDYQKQP